MAQQESHESTGRSTVWEQREAISSEGDAAFRSHLTIYLVIGLFLLSLNLLTSPGELWFYWPLFFWGWALVFHAVGAYGAEAPWRALAAVRSIVPGLGAPIRLKGTPGEGNPGGIRLRSRTDRRAQRDRPTESAPDRVAARGPVRSIANCTAARSWISPSLAKCSTSSSWTRRPRQAPAATRLSRGVPAWSAARRFRT